MRPLNQKKPFEFVANVRKILLTFSRVYLFAILLPIATTSLAHTTLFFDDFHGPAMSPDWVANGLPTRSNPNSYPFYVSYAGTPNIDFQTIDGASTLHMSTRQPPLHRVGWTLNTVFTNSSFRYEVRFNTLTQSRTTSIDGCIELWILDAANSNRFDIVGLFGSWYDASPKFMADSAVDQSYFAPDFAYRNNTWYRLIIEGGTNQKIRAILCDDQGKELLSQAFAHDTRVFPAGFKIGLSQGMGTPNSTYPMDIAVDYASVSTLSGPEPELAINPVVGGLALQWPVSYPFVLESTPRLSPPVEWTPVSNPITVLDGFNSVIVPPDGPSAFFRLRYQSP